MTALPRALEALRSRMPDTTSLVAEPVHGFLGGAHEPIPSVNTPSPLPRPGSEERAEPVPMVATRESAPAEVKVPPAFRGAEAVRGTGAPRARRGKRGGRFGGRP